MFTNVLFTIFLWKRILPLKHTLENHPFIFVILQIRWFFQMEWCQILFPASQSNDLTLRPQSTFTETAGGSEDNRPPTHQVAPLPNNVAKITAPLSAFPLIYGRNINIRIKSFPCPVGEGPCRFTMRIEHGSYKMLKRLPSCHLIHYYEDN